MLLNILNYLYLCVWAILLLHCLQNKRPCLILGGELGTKAFWLFTFVFFNPILSLLYVFCVFYPEIVNWKNKRFSSVDKLKNAENLPMLNKYMLAVLLTLTCLILVFFEVSRTKTEIPPVTQLNKDAGTAIKESHILKSGLNLGIIDAKNKIQTISSSPSNNKDNASFRSIVLVCKSEQYFLEQIAQNIQKSLYKLPYVETVTCYMSDELPDPNAEQPNIFISLKISDLKEDKFLLARNMDVKIYCAASSSISEALSESGRNSTSGQADSFTIKSQLHHISKTLCIECPGTEYEHEVKNISNVLTEAFKKQFENQIKNSEKPSEVLYGTNTVQF